MKLSIIHNRNQRQPCNGEVIPRVDFRFWTERRSGQPQQQQQQSSRPLPVLGQGQGFGNNNRPGNSGNRNPNGNTNFGGRG
jgi:hypothetical protein